MPKRRLKNDGERMVPAFHDNTLVYGEHVSRYEAVLPIVKNRIVLDIASGSGYGTQMLATEAKYVYGVDISAAAVEYAKENYNSKNIEYAVGDGEDIPMPSNSVDVIVTFETIEHIKDYKKFMKEIVRVLKPDGLAIISTPNDLEFAEGNHFHLHEFVHGELLDLIKTEFKQTVEYFQASWLYSGLMAQEKLTSTWRNEVLTYNLSPKKINECTYFYVLASNRDITEKVEENGALSQHWSGRRHLLDMQKNHDTIVDLQRQNTQLEEDLLKLETEYAELSERLNNPADAFRRFSLKQHAKHYFHKRILHKK